MNLRSHVFLALITHATNEAFRSGRIDLNGPNRSLVKPRPFTVIFDAPLGESMPVRVCLGDWNHDEARITVVAWPSHEVDRWIESGARKAGDVVASGWISRTPYLRVLDWSFPSISLPKSRVEAMKALPAPGLDTDPLGIYPREFGYAAVA